MVMVDENNFTTLVDYGCVGFVSCVKANWPRASINEKKTNDKHKNISKMSITGKKAKQKCWNKYVLLLIYGQLDVYLEYAINH